jgi:hypothetical protein
MTMRADEEFVKDAIVGTLPSPPQKTVPGGKRPPDLTLHFGPSAVALEVTTLSDVYASPDGTIGNRRTVDEFLFRINNDLLREYSSRVQDGQFLLIHYQGPIANPRAYRRQLKVLLEGRLRSGGFSNTEFETFNIAGSKVDIGQRAIDRRDRKRIVGLISNKHSIINIEQHAAFLLAGAIAKKNAIVSRIRFSGDKWLGLLNQYFLADQTMYRRALSGTTTANPFSRVYVVSLDGAIEDIMESDRITTSTAPDARGRPRSR